MPGHSAAYFSCLLWKLSMEDPSPIFSSKYKAISKPIVLYPSKYFYSFRFFTEGSVHKNVNNDVNFVLLFLLFPNKLVSHYSESTWSYQIVLFHSLFYVFGERMDLNFTKINCLISPCQLFSFQKSKQLLRKILLAFFLFETN